MQNGLRTPAYSVVALLAGLSLGVIFSDNIQRLFSGDPDNIYTLENGKFTYPIDPQSDTLIIPVDFPPDSTGQMLTFIINPAWSGQIFFIANPGSGFADKLMPQFDHAFAPTLTFPDPPPAEPVVEYSELLKVRNIEQSCKIQVTGGGVYRLMPRQTHWEITR